MRARVLIVIAAAGLALVAAGCGSPSSPGTASSSPSRTPLAPLWAAPGTAAAPAKVATALQKALDKAVASGVTIGASAAVITPAYTWVGASGADIHGTKLAPTSAMSLASITKTFTAAEVMLLSWRGQVNLDAPVTDYVSLPFDAKGATVRQLLAMRSGFPDYLATDALKTVPDDLSKVWTDEELIAAIPADAPGQGTVGGATAYYNNTNYLVLDALIAKVTGVPAATALHRDLIDPAGLKRTWVQPADSTTAPRAYGFGGTLGAVDVGGAVLPSTSAASSLSGAGDMAGDAADTALWGYLLYGGRLIDSSLVTEMESNGVTEETMGITYALGTSIEPLGADTAIVGHGGGGTRWPYTDMLAVWTGDSPVAVAVLTPQSAESSMPVEIAFSLQEVAASSS